MPLDGVTWVKKSQPTASDVHIDAALTDISVGFIQSADNFVARRVFPVVPVVHKTDKYFTWDRGNFWRDTMQKREDGQESAGGGFTLSNDSYSCDVWALHKDIGPQLRANADPAADPDQAATVFLSQQALIRQERQWASDYFAASIWATDVTGGSNFTQWDDSSSDPEADIDTGKKTILQNTGQRANTLVVGYSVHQALKRHPLIKDRYKHTSSESITAEMIARFLEIDRYMVAMGVYASANEGASETFAFIQGLHALLAYVAPAPALMTPSAGYTFVWSGLTGMNDLGVTTSSFYIDQLKADRVEIETAFDMKVVSTACGYFFASAVSA